MAAELAPDLPPEVVTALVAAWAQLYGLVGFELFGQFNNVVVEREAFFRHAAAGSPTVWAWCFPRLCRSGHAVAPCRLDSYGRPWSSGTRTTLPATVPDSASRMASRRR